MFSLNCRIRSSSSSDRAGLPSVWTRAFFPSAILACLKLDSRSLIKSANHRSADLLGRTLAELQGVPLAALGVLLLVAIVAAIALTLRDRRETRYQNPGEQVLVKRNDRLRILKIASEKPTAAETPAVAVEAK